MCTRTLRTDLNPTADAGGTWTYVGYSNVATGPFGASPSTPLVSESPGADLTGDDPEVDSDGVDPGYYKFTYSVESELGCVGTKDLIIEVLTPRCPGGDFEIDVCSDDPAFSLVGEWTSAAGVGCSPVYLGTFSNPSSPSGPNGSSVGFPPAWNFIPSANDFGEHTFVNTVTTLPVASGFTANCEDCTQTATGIVNLSQAASPGTKQFVPYLSVCLDPGCEVQLSNLVLNASIGLGQVGTWTFLGPETTLSVNGGSFDVYAVDDVLVTGSISGTVNFSMADVDEIYSFRYTTSPGLPCERSVDVDVYLGPTPNPGTPPSNVFSCYKPFVGTALGGDPEINLWDQLGGSPSTQGTWTITGVLNSGTGTTQNAINLAISAAHDVGDETPTYFLNGTDNTFNFETFRDLAGVGLVPVPPGTDITLTFTYTAALPGSYLCVNCTPGQSIWTVRLQYSYDVGTTDYDSVPNAYQCDACDIALADLIDDESDQGTWTVAPASYPGAQTIPNLIVNGGSPNDRFPSQAIGGHGVQTDWSQVPPGVYIVRYRTGGTNSCTNDLYVYIEVIGCTEPCDGDLEVRWFYVDISDAINQATLDFITIASFEVNSVEQLGGPEGLGTKSTIPLSTGGSSCNPCSAATLPGTINYVTNLVDTLNSLAIPGFYFEYPTAADVIDNCDLKAKFFKMKYPSCYTFSILLDNGGVWTATYSDTGYSGTGNWVSCYDSVSASCGQYGPCFKILPDENIC